MMSQSKHATALWQAKTCLIPAMQRAGFQWVLELNEPHASVLTFTKQGLSLDVRISDGECAGAGEWLSVAEENVAAGGMVEIHKGGERLSGHGTARFAPDWVKVRIDGHPRSFGGRPVNPRVDDDGTVTVGLRDVQALGATALFHPQ